MPCSNPLSRNASPPSWLPSIPLDEKDEEIARWKRAYHDALAEKTNKNDADKKNLWVTTQFKPSALILPVSTPSLKTLGRGIPKLVSLFDLVKRVVQLADKHELWEAGQLPDEEFRWSQWSWDWAAWAKVIWKTYHRLSHMILYIASPAVPLHWRNSESSFPTSRRKLTRLSQMMSNNFIVQWILDSSYCLVSSNQVTAPGWCKECPWWWCFQTHESCCRMIESAVPSRASPVSNQARWPWYTPSYYGNAPLAYSIWLGSWRVSSSFGIISLCSLLVEYATSSMR